MQVCRKPLAASTFPVWSVSRWTQSGFQAIGATGDPALIPLDMTPNCLQSGRQWFICPRRRMSINLAFESSSPLRE